MICTDRIEEIVESARRGGKPDADLDAHLASCSECSERWKAECELTSHFRVMRIHALARRPAGPARFLDRNGETLVREFERRHSKTPMATRAASWAWTLAAAAALLLAVGVGRELGRRSSGHSVAPPVRSTGFTRGARESGTILYEASMDTAALSGDDFIAVPYAPPLATGELVRVVRTDLYPEALANMGIDLNPEWAGDMAADVVVGQDGFPRAVRIAGGTQ
jgi:hypothetical protein